MSVAFLISCEHAVNAVPPAHARLFTDAALLTSHRGWDPGALDTAKAWASALNAPLFAASVTGLLCDCNRSPSNPSVWSSVTRALPPAEKNAILAAWHAPYRTAVGRSAAELLQTHARVLHLAAHSFTPILDGQRRNMDLGLLYDPSRPAEKSLAGAWRRELRRILPELRVRLNAPYRGISDGLPAALRKCLGEHYLGVEVEFNQALLEHGAFPALPVLQALTRALTFHEQKPGGGGGDLRLNGKLAYPAETSAARFRTKVSPGDSHAQRPA